MDLASRHGLDSLTIGELAKELDLSKSGLFAHFGSKEELQIATIEAAEKVFGGAIVKPAETSPPGLCRLSAYLENDIRYLEDRVFPGGCFFAAAAAEYDDRPGRIRDRIALSIGKWRDLLTQQARIASENAELIPSVDPFQLVFELKAFIHEANFNHQLLHDEDVHVRARRGIRDRLWNAASEFGRRALAPSLEKS